MGSSEGRAARARVESRCAELRQGANQHRDAVVAGCEQIVAATAELDMALRKALRLHEAVKEAVSVLEETKRSFKSKRLGELRQRLVAVLSEVAS